VADRSRHERQQPEKPGRRRFLTAEFGGQSEERYNKEIRKLQYYSYDYCCEQDDNKIIVVVEHAMNFERMTLAFEKNCYRKIMRIELGIGTSLNVTNQNSIDKQAMFDATPSNCRLCLRHYNIQTFVYT